MRTHRFRQETRIAQGLAEMMGVVRGIIADGSVSVDEANRLARWTRDNPDVAQRWPANVLSRRLERIVRDGRVDTRERKHLQAILGQFAENQSGLNFPLATDLPVDEPPPPVVFEGNTFVFAGDMAFGPHRACEREVVELGGACERSVTRRTDYLVIGALAASDWFQDGFGTQVNEVVQLRTRGATIAIVSEEHWMAALP
jgi:hypothetical protein